MRHTLQLVTSLGLLAGATAAVISRSPVERVYLVDCGSPSSSERNTSQVGYYANNAGYEEGENPTALYDFGHLVTWEGSNVTAPLSNGDVFTSQIITDAANKDLYAVVGNGTSTTESWVIRKRYSGTTGDGGGLAWYTADGQPCISLYEVATS